MGLFSKPKTTKKTGEQKATEIRTRSLLDKEIEDEEDRFKMLARGKLGRSSLLSGAPRDAQEAASGRRGGSSLLKPTGPFFGQGRTGGISSGTGGSGGGGSRSRPDRGSITRNRDIS